MPYKSQAQAGYFHTHKAQLEKEGVDVDEWDSATKGKKLPKRAKKTHKMNATSKLVRLSELSHNLDAVIKFDYDDDEDNKKSLWGTAAKGGALVGAGVGGTLAHQAIARGGGYGQFGKQLGLGYGIGKSMGGSVPYGKILKGAASDFGSAPGASLGAVAGASARGIGTQVGGALAKLKTLLPAVKGLESKEKDIRFDEHLLEPWGDNPKTKIVTEEFPAGLSPAAALKFPFPKLMRYLNRPQQLRTQFSKREKLVQMGSILDDLIKFSIHIDPKNKGKFDATKKKTGESTEELEHSKNPKTRKRAVFAENAKKWHH